MKSLLKMVTCVASISLTLSLSSCASAVDLKEVGESCRPPGDWTWVNPIDGVLESDFIIWAAVNMTRDETNDPSVNCVLSALDAPSDVIERLRATDTIGLEQETSWAGYDLVWYGVTLGNGEEGFLYIRLEKQKG